MIFPSRGWWLMQLLVDPIEVDEFLRKRGDAIDFAEL